MLIHDVIKIQYNREGYLPDIPYHLVSEDEMCDAFITLPGDLSKYITSDYFGPTVDETKTTVDWFNAFLNDTESISFFKDKYPLIDDVILEYYKSLVNRIFYEIQEFKNNLDVNKVLPDWIYSYMLGVVVGPESSKLDIHDMILAMGVDNLQDEYTLECAIQCLRISKDWLKKVIVPSGEVLRPPTMFGEPHVLKAIRLMQESLTIEELHIAD